MPRFTIHHVTRYTYEEPVRDSANQIILFPIRDEYQELVRQHLRISGEPPVEVYKDYFGNEVGFFTYAEPHTELMIDSQVEVLVRPRNMPEDNIPLEEQWQHLLNVRYQVPFIDFLKQEYFQGIEEVKEATAMLTGKTHTPLERARELNAFVFAHFSYNKEVTDVETTLDQIWKLRAGVCQDFAHILLVLLRMNDIPSRYVSGYICPNKNGMRGEGATHAWVEAYIPYYGWLGLDPTNNCVVNDLHVRLATGRNFSNVSPVKGAYKGIANHTLQVGVSVSYEDGHTVDTTAAVLAAQPAKRESGNTLNSYRRHLEMIQQQQQ
jgi:transglutaminase-like putative cysteine protease